MHASFGNYSPSNYKTRPGDAIAEVGKLFGEAVGNLPNSIEKGVQMRTAMRQRAAEEQAKNEIRDRLINVVGMAPEDVPPPMKEEKAENYVKRLVPHVYEWERKMGPGTRQAVEGKIRALQESGAVQEAGDSGNRVAAGLQQGQPEAAAQAPQQQQEAPPPPATPTTVAPIKIHFGDTLSNIPRAPNMAAAPYYGNAGSMSVMNDAVNQFNTQIAPRFNNSTTDEIREVERQNMGDDWNDDWRNYTPPAPSNVPPEEQAAPPPPPPPATPVEAQPDIPAAPAQPTQAAQAPGEIPTTYRGSAETTNQGQDFQARVYDTGARAGFPGYDEKYFNLMNAQGANLQTGAEKDIAAGITQSQLNQKYSEAEKAAQAKRAHENHKQVVDGLVKGFERAFKFQKDGRPITQISISDISAHPENYTATPVPYSYLASVASSGQREDNQDLVNLKNATQVFNTAVERKATIINQIEAAKQKQDFPQVKALNAELTALNGTVEASEALLNVTANSVTNVDARKILESHAERQGEYHARSGDQRAPLKGFEASYNKGVQKVEAEEQAKQERAINRQIKKAQEIGEKYKGGPGIVNRVQGKDRFEAMSEALNREFKDGIPAAVLTAALNAGNVEQKDWGKIKITVGVK